MVNFPEREFSYADIRRAGKLLAEDIPAEHAVRDDVLRAFKIAHNWRLSHAYPMIAERIRLAKIASGGIVTAGRVKRMTSIRKKLRLGSTNLRSMQDLGGCRAVMRDMGEVQCVVRAYADGASKSSLTRVSDYIENPKGDGYRGFHLICEFGGSTKGDVFNGQSMEIQVRTVTQHVWATAIETVGAIRNEDLKAGKGDAKWLRLMALMSHYMALQDGLPLAEGFPTERALCEEIADLSNQAMALQVIDAFQAVVRSPIKTGRSGEVYELFFDAKTGRVEARRQTWLDLETKDFGVESESSQHVVVSVDKVDDLRRAFPNFYLDISSFRSFLSQASSGAGMLHPRSSNTSRPSESKIDLSFLAPSGKIRT